MRKILLLLTTFAFFSYLASSQEQIFQVYLDPRIELLSVIQSLSDWPDHGAFTRLDFEYRNEVNNYFSEYKDHPAVRWFNENIMKGWSFDAPPKAMLHLTDPPDMKVKIPFTGYLLVRGGGPDNLHEMIRLMNQFYIDTDFKKFSDSQSNFYEAFLEKVRNQIPYESYCKLMTDFYGEKMGHFIFLPVPLFHSGGYGCLLEAGEEVVAYYLGGPHKVDNDFPVYDTALLRELVFHEFGHSFVNPLVYEDSIRVNQYSSLHRYMEKAMGRQAYKEWTTVCHEHLVRTGEILLNELAGFPDDAIRIYDLYLNKKGFLLLPFFLEKMKIYVSHRQRYPTLESYLPELLKVFEEVKAVPDSLIPGGMNFVMDINPDRCIIKRFLENSPFEEAGCKPGDEIKSINDISFNGNNYFDIINMWSNSYVGQNYALEIRRKGEELLFDVIVKPDTIFKFIKKEHPIDKP